MFVYYKFDKPKNFDLFTFVQERMPSLSQKRQEFEVRAYNRNKES
jgi:hypothetical protein